MFRFHVDRDDGVWVPLSASSAHRGALARCTGEAWTQSGRDGEALDVRFRAGDLIIINYLDDDGDASVEAVAEARGSISVGVYADFLVVVVPAFRSL